MNGTKNSPLTSVMVREGGPQITRLGGRQLRSAWTQPIARGLESRLWAYLLSSSGVALAIIAGLGLKSLVELPNASMIFLLAVLFAAVQFGVGPALLASVLSFLSYNFFFIEPLHTFSVTQPHELLSLFVFLAVAILTSAIAGRAREEATKVSQRARASRRLYEFARRLSGLADAQSVLDGAAIQVEGDLQRQALILVPEKGTLAVSAAWPPEDRLDAESLAVAMQAFQRGEPTGAGTDYAPQTPWLFLPLRTRERPVGVVGIAHRSDAPPIDQEAQTFFRTVTELTATALERARLGHEISEARAAAEAERLRNTLLASVSHDFRTPLASVLGAATSLIDYGAKLPEASRLDLLTQIKEEAEHLDGMVRNLLAVTRLQAGALEIRHDWLDPHELFDRAVATAKRRGATQSFCVSVAEGLPFFAADPILMAQVMSNLIGNAIRYSGPQAHVELRAWPEKDTLFLSVTDDGPGISAQLLPRVFNRFVRVSSDGDAGEGTGLGLTIAKGIIEAHRGFIRAESPVRDGRGTRILMSLPRQD